MAACFNPFAVDDDEDDWGDLPKLTKADIVWKQTYSPTTVIIVPDEKDSNPKDDGRFSFTEVEEQAEEQAEEAQEDEVGTESTPKVSNIKKSSFSVSPVSSTTTVPVILEDIRHLLEDKSESEGFVFLQGMVLDLLNEVDCLKMAAETQDIKIRRLEEERSIMNTDCRENLCAVLVALQKATGDEEIEVVKLSEDDIISSVNATQLVIGQLTKKIEELNIENTQLYEHMQAMQDRFDDLQGLNETRGLKIQALEGHFRSINTARIHLASKLMERHSSRNKKPRSSSPTSTIVEPELDKV